MTLFEGGRLPGQSRLHDRVFPPAITPGIMVTGFPFGLPIALPSASPRFFSLLALIGPVLGENSEFVTTPGAG